MERACKSPLFMLQYLSLRDICSRTKDTKRKFRHRKTKVQTERNIYKIGMLCGGGTWEKTVDISL